LTATDADASALATAAVSERYDLLEYISNSPEAFFGELGQDLFSFGMAVPLSATVRDRLDLLAVHWQGRRGRERGARDVVWGREGSSDVG
jgi:hypothetical protein